MKQTISRNRYCRAFAIFALLPVFLLISCNNDDDQGENNNNQNMEQIRTIMASGTWTIVLYNDSGADETGNYEGYTFTFNSNGTLVAEQASETYSGTWSVTDSDDSNDDNSSNDNSDLDFNIAFSAPEVLVELTDDWDIDTYSSTRIELFDISGGDNSTDLLTFQKN